MTAQSIPIEDRKVLHLGSGNKYDPGAVNLDLTAVTKPDVVHDLDALPWPFPDDRFSEVRAFDVIEHLDNLISTFEEIHRVCQDGAKVQITVPHYSCANAFTDPTHRHYFGYYSFHYFTGEHQFSFYTSRRFRSSRINLVFKPSLFNKLVWRFANRWPAAYESRWAWIFPAWFLSVELQVSKPAAAVEADAAHPA